LRKAMLKSGVSFHEISQLQDNKTHWVVEDDNAIYLCVKPSADTDIYIQKVSASSTYRRR
jgi:hypothetical protein